MTQEIDHHPVDADMFVIFTDEYLLGTSHQYRAGLSHWKPWINVKPKLNSMADRPVTIVSPITIIDSACPIKT